MNLEQYIDNVNQKLKAGNATEHTFRGVLEQLIESIVPGISATNEPKRQSCGAPDYILTKKKYITQYPIDGDNVVSKPHFSFSPPSEGCPQDGVVNSLSTEGRPTAEVVNLSSELRPQAAVVNSPSELHTQDEVVNLPSDVNQDKSIYINSIKLRLNPILELPYNHTLKKRARDLRQAENLPEVLFWMQVTKGGFHKIDFDRQRVIGNYIVDFYVKKLGLVIEIDGSSHIGKEEYDKEREEYLCSLGLRVYRIQVIDVMKRMGGVMRDLEDFLIENFGETDKFAENKNFPPRPAGIPTQENFPPRPLGTPPKEGNETPHDTCFPPKEGNLGRVYINDTQYFANVPEVAWNFYIGGYQPAQKWLKDRKGRKLEFDDILHYQKIIVALSETDRIMKEIDKIEIE